MTQLNALVVALVVVVAVVSVQCQTPTFSMSDVSNYELIGSFANSGLYKAQLARNQSYEFDIQVVHLRGNRTEMGMAYGKLLGQQVIDCYKYVTDMAFPPRNLTKRLTLHMIERVAEWQWEDFLSVQVSPQHIQELEGIAAVNKEAATILKRIIVLANLPSDEDDLKYILLDEINNKMEKKQVTRQEGEMALRVITDMFADHEKGMGPQCSMFGVWGTRTGNGELFSARNLDYGPDTGVNRWKLVTVWHPTDGGIAHASIGYVALYGCLTGMNKVGVTVAEANLESNVETFRGYPWVLRLRYILENSVNVSQAKTLWENTNNTIGYNHQVCASSDVATGARPALAMETMARYTAYFYDNDPREQNATCFSKWENKEIVYGFPLSDALWRTNHPYDPETRKTYQWWTYNAGKWSYQRYMFAHEAFVSYQQRNVQIGLYEALNITAVLGDKGKETPYFCQNKKVGTNIISVTFRPKSNQMHAAWEDGAGDSWRPACCNTYVNFDLTGWW